MELLIKHSDTPCSHLDWNILYQLDNTIMETVRRWASKEFQEALRYIQTREEEGVTLDEFKFLMRNRPNSLDMSFGELILIDLLFSSIAKYLK